MSILRLSASGRLCSPERPVATASSYFPSPRRTSSAKVHPKATLTIQKEISALPVLWNYIRRQHRAEHGKSNEIEPPKQAELPSVLFLPRSSPPLTPDPALRHETASAARLPDEVWFLVEVDLTTHCSMIYFFTTLPHFLEGTAFCDRPWQLRKHKLDLSRSTARLLLSRVLDQVGRATVAHHCRICC